MAGVSFKVCSGILGASYFSGNPKLAQILVNIAWQYVQVTGLFFLYAIDENQKHIP